jgi:hypothetical protein
MNSYSLGIGDFQSDIVRLDLTGGNNINIYKIKNSAC